MNLKVGQPLGILSLTAPVAMGYIPLGAVFGFLFVQAGGNGWMALLSSLIVYAGAAQYMMIPMLVAGMPIATIAFATLVINVRHIFYGLSLLTKLPIEKPLRWYFMFALTDETYSVLTTMPASTSGKKMALIAMLNQFWWILGTAAGVILGAQAKISLAGLDFCLAALFAVLTVEQWRQRTSSLPVWFALIAYAIAYVLAPKHALAISIALSLLANLLYQAKSTSPEGQS